MVIHVKIFYVEMYVFRKVDIGDNVKVSSERRLFRESWSYKLKDTYWKEVDVLVENVNVVEERYVDERRLTIELRQ